MQIKKQPGMEQWIGSKLGKEYVKAVYCHSVYLNYMQSPSCEMLGWIKFSNKLKSSFLGEISIISDMQITPSLWQKAKRKLKNLSMKVKKESEKSWLETQHSKNEDHGIWSHHLMADRWGNNGNSERLYFGGTPKSLQMVTAAMKLKDTCSLEE